MAQTDKKKGPIKAVEVSTESLSSETNVLSTISDRQDFMSVLKSLKDFAVNAQRKSINALISTSKVTWVNRSILIPDGSSLIVKMLCTTSDSQSKVLNFIIEGSVSGVFPSSATPEGGFTKIEFTETFLQDQMIVIELNQDVIDSSPANGNIIVGLDEAGPLPRLQSKQHTRFGSSGQAPYKSEYEGSTSPEPTQTIALAVEPSNSSSATDLLWVINGTYWQNGTSQTLSGALSPITAPVGSIIAWHRPDGQTDANVDQTLVDLLAGNDWQLCDGSQIVNGASPINGSYTPNLNGNTSSAIGNNGTPVISVAYTQADYNDTYFSLDPNTDLCIWTGTISSGSETGYVETSVGGAVSPASWPKLSIGARITGPNLQDDTRVLDYFVADDQQAAGSFNNTSGVNVHGTARLAVIVRLSKPALADMTLGGGTYYIGAPTYLAGSLSSSAGSYNGDNTAISYLRSHTHYFKTNGESTLKYNGHNTPVAYYGTGSGNKKLDKGGNWPLYQDNPGDSTTWFNGDAWVGHTWNTYYSGYGLPHENRPKSFDVIYLIRIK